jgi:superfamily II DNA/RNA helicase
MPRSLILEPTRELLRRLPRISRSTARITISMALLIGGVQMGDQVKALSDGVDVLIATPGRLMDLFERGKILLTGCELLVIDEADRMLDMGFIPDIENICTKLPTNGRRCCFRQPCRHPSRSWPTNSCRTPRSIEVARAGIRQHQYRPAQGFCRNRACKKREVLREVAARRRRDQRDHLLQPQDDRARTEQEPCQQDGFASGEIHGDMDQSSRIAELDRFKDGKINILVASDVAARGLDIKGVSHVFNFDAPWHP